MAATNPLQIFTISSICVVVPSILYVNMVISYSICLHSWPPPAYRVWQRMPWLMCVVRYCPSSRTPRRQLHSPKWYNSRWRAGLPNSISFCTIWRKCVSAMMRAVVSCSLSCRVNIRKRLLYVALNLNYISLYRFSACNKMGAWRALWWCAVRNIMIWKSITPIFYVWHVTVKPIRRICSDHIRNSRNSIRNYVCTFRWRNCIGECCIFVESNVTKVINAAWFTFLRNSFFF